MRGVVCVLLSIIIAAYAAEFIQVEKPIESKYIIVMNDKTTISERDAFLDVVREEMTRDASNISVINDVFDIFTMVGYMATLSPQLLEFHKNSQAIKYVEEDQMMSINYKQENHPVSIEAATVTQTGSTWGLARISRTAATGSTNYIYDSVAGAGITIYVIDTGVYTAHEQFEGRAKAGFNAISGESGQDLNGHGTHCAGTTAGKTYGVAKKAAVVGVKVLDADGSGTNSGVIAGIQYVSKNGTPKKSVANMSLGGGYSAALNQAVAAVVAAGIPFAVAAGNENQNACNTSPASEPTAVTVGAITNTNARSSFSNYGTCVDVFAPGSNILSAWIGSTTATNTISGTSMASPHVCGIIAQQLSISSSFTTKTLISDATSGQVSSPGSGSPNLIAFSPY